MTRSERAVLATSQARDLCLSLQRAFAGPHALDRLRAGEAAALAPDALRVALGLAWAAGSFSLVRAGLAGLSEDRVAGGETTVTRRTGHPRAGPGLGSPRPLRRQ